MIRNVLIVDDNSANLYMLESLLKGYGCEVTSAENGKEALDKARANPPDLVVTDILMPVMDGYALCREWKSDDTLKYIPLIFYTATYTEPRDEKFALSLGADRFIIKPQEPEIFMNMLKEVLEDKYTVRQALTKPLGEEMEFFRRHNEILFNKLEKKMLDLEIANQKLRISEECYRLSFENSMDVVYTIDTDLNVLTVSPSVERILGYKPQDFVGWPVSHLGKILTAESFEQAVADIRLILKGETIPAAIYRFIAKDGTIKYCEVNGSPLIREGKIIGMVSVARDITERKQAEDKLRESEKKYRDLFDFLPIPVYEMDLQANITSANRAIYETFIGTEEDLKKGIKAWQLLSSEEIEKSGKNIQRLLKGEHIERTEYTLMRLDGSVFPAMVISSVIYSNGKPVGLRGAIVDITDRRQMEVALASEHDRLAAILDGIPIPAFMINRDHIVVLWNRNNEIFTGKTKEEMLGKRQDLSFLFKDKTPPSLAELVLEMSDEEIILKYGFRGVRKSDIFPGAFESIGTIYPGGEERIMSIQAARIYNPQGEIIGAIQTAQDITERVRIQDDREKLQSQLIQAQKMEAIGTLAGGIAHDFNNILSGIMGYTELYKEAVQDRPKVYQGMEQVLKAATRAKDLVRQILTFSRKTEHEKKPIALAPMVKEVVKFMRASMPTTIEITQKIEETSDVIMADPTQLHQVLINLCTNAGHAMKDTGGVLEIGLEEVVITADDLLHRPPIKHGHYLVLTVRDTGRGIPQENIGRIFEPYFTTKEKGEGTGLGLAVVHGIVKDHGGEIRVYSEVGKGTIFRVYLPLNEKQTESGNDMEEAIIPGYGETILFVDDEEMVANLSKELLEKLGYRVVTETDPVKAIEIFMENSDAFDIVITDKTMPHMTGFDMVREIRHIRADIPVVLSSGFQEKGDMEKLTALGINRLITKPIKISALSKAIRDVLDKDKSKI